MHTPNPLLTYITERYDYDAWFDLTRLEECEYRTLRLVMAEEDEGSGLGMEAGAAAGGAGGGGGGAGGLARARARAREAFERAVGSVPMVPEKRFWRRYVYLWIHYALFEELECGDVGR